MADGRRLQRLGGGVHAAQNAEQTVDFFIILVVEATLLHLRHINL